MTTTLTRYKACGLCGERPAATKAGVCRLCDAELERRAMDDYAIENEPTCAFCGGVLTRNGHCFSQVCMPECFYGPAEMVDAR